MIKKILVVLITILPFDVAFSNERNTTCSLVEGFLHQQEQDLKIFLKKQKRDLEAFLQKQEMDLENGNYEDWSFADIDLTQDSELYAFLQKQEVDLDVFLHKQRIERSNFFGKETLLSCPVINKEVPNPFELPSFKEGCLPMNKKEDIPDHLHNLILVHFSIIGSFRFFSSHCPLQPKSDQ